MNRSDTMRAAVVLALSAILSVPGQGAPPEDSAVSPERSCMAAALAEMQRLSQHAAALASTADQRLRTARGAASDYLNRQAAAAPRMRGIHILSTFVCESAEGGESAETRCDWLPLSEVEVPEQLVLLIHGLDEPGRVWDDLAPALAAHGHAVARFDYPNDQSIGASADMLAGALRELKALEVQRIVLVGHSKGGLVARDVLTRTEHYASAGRGHDDLPDVPRLIMLGTPNRGSPWARLQCLSDAAEQVDRLFNDPDWNARHLLGFLADGRGEAAADLLPGSAFLNDLNARTLPSGVAMTTIVAVIDPTAAEPAPCDAAPLLSLQGAAELRRTVSGRLGDGVVSVESAQLEGVEDVVFVEASHRGMIRRSMVESSVRWAIRSSSDQPPGVSIVLERLGDGAADR